MSLGRLPRTFLLPTMGVALMGSSGASIDPILSKILPAQAQGWTAPAPDGLYGPDNLFDLIDGGAEVYRALDVRAVLARRYAKEGSPEILADLFDMGSGSDAWGAYHHDLREGEPAGIGRESEYADGSLAFWKGRYFVSIVSLEETPAARLAIFDLARQAAASIPGMGEPPALIGLLPDEGLVRSQIHYFHTQALLDRYYPIAGESPLGLSAGSEGIVARFRPSPAGAGAGGGAPCVALIVSYPSPGEAAGAAGRVVRNLLVEADARGVGRLRGGGWGGVAAADRILLAVLDASSRSEVEARLDGMIRRGGGASPKGSEGS